MTSKIARLRDAAARRQGGRCCYCGQPMLPASAPGPLRCTAEHLVARSAGGGDTAENIAAACWYCNTRRHSRRTPPAPGLFREQVRRRLGEQRWHWRLLIEDR